MLRNKGYRRCKWWLWLLVIGLIITALIIYFSIIVLDHPPEVNDFSSLEIKREEVGTNTFILGNNWLRKSESGLWEMYIEGDPFERGVAFGKLTRELLLFQETVFVDQIKEMVPSGFYLKFLKYFVAWFNRNLDENIIDEYKFEIYGTSFSCSPEFDFIGSGYQRQLNYHAAHDIGHVLQGLNMVGCTSFSCWNDKSADSSLIIGRNFDFYAGKKFDDNKIVCFYKPTSGYKFMMITWADMIGVVSGMNEKGLTITINASKSSIPSQASTPVTLLAREILQYAETIDQACNIARKRKLFVSESILVGSFKDRESAIIEKSPDKYDIVYSPINQIVCSNHFQGKEFAKDKTNLENISGSDSYYRYERVNELLNQDRSVDVRDVVSILRNRYGLDNVNLGMGNPLAINQLIAHHSVVFKPDSLLVWVSTSPYQLGKFVAYDLNKIFSVDQKEIRENHEIYTETLTIPADSFLYSEDFKNFQYYLEFSEKLKQFRNDKAPFTDSFEKEYIKTNPHYYLTYIQLGDYFRAMKNFNRAYTYYNIALSKEIPGNDKRMELTETAQKLLKKSNHAYTGN
jgi:isopenicillin-N N-acyltransferase-like protein